MRPRVNKGTLVCSTNPFRHIKSRRLIVEILYNFRKGIVKERIINVRERLEQ